MTSRPVAVRGLESQSGSHDSSQDTPAPDTPAPALAELVTILFPSHPAREIEEWFLPGVG